MMAVKGAAEENEQGRARKGSLERVLPKDVQTSIESEVAAASSIDRTFIDKLDRTHDLTGRFDLSRRRLRLYVNRVRRRCQSPDDRSARARDDDAARWRRQIEHRRRRQASVAAVLNQTFGTLAASNPDLWERRAYLMLVGLVYERLATQEEDISTDELVALAKILAENRRANGRVNDKNTERGVTSSRSADRLPPYFATMVQEVYGVNTSSCSEEDEERADASGSRAGETKGGGVGG